MLVHTKCPLDGTDDADVEVFPANWDPAQVDTAVFSARRMPDRLHYRMVRNRRTGCLRADPILDEDTILNLYRGSKVTYESLADYTGATYARYLKSRVLPVLADRRGALEIGCGHGFFLKALHAAGFQMVRGVEPSEDAMAKAPAEIRPEIVLGYLKEETFPANSFSLVCGFQVLDHLVQPNEVLQMAYRMLAPGGVMYWICHDIRSWPARLLGRRCPMLDIEHVVLYDQQTIRKLFEKNGFAVEDVFRVWDRYPADYWAHLAPLPQGLKGMMRGMMDGLGLGRVPLSVCFGNQCIIARKPS